MSTDKILKKKKKKRASCDLAKISLSSAVGVRTAAFLPLLPFRVKPTELTTAAYVSEELIAHTLVVVVIVAAAAALVVVVVSFFLLLLLLLLLLNVFM